MALADTLATVLYHGYEGTEGWTGFPNEGTIIIFGVVLLPIYVMIIAWFTGTPRATKTGLLGVTYLVGIATAMWVSMLILTVLIGIIFYGAVPSIS
ncbi:hypothetical protein [Natronolimnohabitans innermongolicus]|uniref:Uncharacterized protein n=1 Tax=Natronolimnohabitans innermongolicus JCM 12255 TaxID=1227499 RepID=L9XNR4_9EURY|nr:hypothetical protein [Natronolimnohabitans innermongolicus]ELY62283.1 hypothetical protein C493_00615 [Natronolimnohabitans innermongolicus JCM 12255]